MLDRRNLLKTGAASATLALLATPALITVARAAAAKTAGTPTPAQAAAGKKLAALFDSFIQEGLDHAPEGVTSLGMDKGKRAHQKSELSQASLAEIARSKAEAADAICQAGRLRPQLSSMTMTAPATTSSCSASNIRSRPTRNSIMAAAARARPMS